MQKNAADRLERAMETALKPGRFIGHRDSWEFVEGLEGVKSQVERLGRSRPRRAIGLCETFIAACYEKAEGVDDSGASFGMFVQDLFCLWIRARRRAKADARETVRQLFQRMDNDDYGFCYKIENKVVKAFDRAGLKTFAAMSQEEFAKELALVNDPEKGDQMTPGAFRLRRFSEVLKVAYSRLGDAVRFLAVVEEMGMTPGDCEELAKIHRNQQRPQEALAWVERGLSLHGEKEWIHESSYELEEMKRDLLKKLGRGTEALDAAWRQFEKAPSIYSYKTLLEYAPKSKRDEWHARVMEVAKGARLSDAIELFVATKEWGRLASLILKTGSEALEGLSHFTTEPAAQKLERQDPLAAAKVFRALGLRILVSGKSKYYGPALEHFEKVRKLLRAAGRDEEWESIVARVRSDHRRKTGFMSEFEALVSQGSIYRTPSFLDLARIRKERYFRPS